MSDTLPPKLSTVDLSDSLIILVYSEPGVGKTEFLASCNTSRAVFFTDLNGIRTASTKNTRVKKLYPLFDPFIESIEPDKSVDSIQGYALIKTRIDYWFAKHLDAFDIVLIDDMTTNNFNALYEAIKLNDLGNRSQTLSKGKKDPARNILPTMADFGTQMGITERFVMDLTSACRKYKKHLVMAAHEGQTFSKTKKEDDEVLTDVAPLFTGRKAPKHLAGYFDFVFRIKRVGKEPSAINQFQCQPDAIVCAKDRDSVFKTIETNLTLDVVFDRVGSTRLSVKEKSLKDSLANVPLENLNPKN